MAIKIIESSKSLIQRIRTDVQRNLEGSNPFLKNGFLSSLTIAFGNRFYDLYRLIDWWKNQFFVNTADVENLQIFADLKNVVRGTSSQSSGPIVITGNVGTILDENSVFTVNQKRYSTRETVEILNRQINVLVAQQLNGLATITTTSEHLLASNIEVTISGAVASEYNGTFRIAVISKNQFTYQINPTAPSSTTGTIVVSLVSAYVNVLSEGTGSQNNLLSGTELKIEVNQPGINANAYVAFGGIEGGTDDESIEQYRQEIINRWQNPLAQFNDEAIIRQCKSVEGVTRVWVKRITPAVGQVTIYFTRDNDESIIPSASEVATVKEILDKIVPMNTDTSDVFVLSPEAVVTNFTITDVIPDSNSMRQSIKNSLDEFFRTSTSEGKTVNREDYESAILNTFDLETGLKLTSFELLSPNGDITVTDCQIATLGQVIFT